MVDFAPGMRTIIRDEEWMIKKIETNSLGNKTLYCVGVSPLVKDREAIFLADLEQIQVVDPAEVKLVADHTPEVLTKCLVKYALKELLEGKTADEILKLTICDIKTPRLIQFNYSSAEFAA